MRWIVIRDKGLAVSVECPKCHNRFTIVKRKDWKCCPICETKVSGYAKRKTEQTEKEMGVMEWIPVDKRLPTKEEQDDELGVLVTLGNDYSGLQFDYYYNGLWDDWNGYVVAWMPLPKPYGERDGE